MKKKITQDWQIALIHWLIAGIAMPFLFSLIFGMTIINVIESFGVIVWLAILGEVIKFFLIWISIIYSAKYISKMFIIKNSLNVVRLATIYLIIFVGGFRLIFFDGSDEINYILSVIHLLSLLVIAPFFYFSSKNYIKNSGEVKEDII
ncbi:MAG: hypothetical protein COX29_03365 [Candidatus Moranbacteria bacterium CG23_combo_of_CG06-09_8_20_14_all_35_22]|nr:MAG: hypothetical protein COX29_03365 [Candidatus Moranbacteria bacterium CG23_combo_of_CG06-09_8_20_14_all_35_22]